MSTTDIKRRQSIRYINDDIEDDAPPSLTFNSLERGDLDDDFPKTNSFMYNSEEDMYRLNSLKRSRMTERMNSNNLEKIDEELENSYQVTKEDESQEGNIIFANLSNIGLKEKKLNLLYIILVCYLIFSIIELIFGYFSNSLTLMADAAHYFSESSCFGIYIITIYASRKKATNNMSFGFHRGEIIGILVRATFLLGFSIWLMYYITKGFLYYNIVNGIIIIIIGVISTLFNLIMGLILIIVGLSNDISFSEKQKNCHHQHSEDDLNCNKIRISFTHIIFTSLQSCIIIIAGVLAYFLPSKLYIDPCCSLILTLILLYNSFNHLGGSIKILMEGSPLEFDVEQLKKDLMEIDGVIDVHDIHVWSLSLGKLSMSCHLITSDPQNSLIKSRELIKKKYNITHTTIQVELNDDKKRKCKGNRH